MPPVHAYFVRARAFFVLSAAERIKGRVGAARAGQGERPQGDVERLEPHEATDEGEAEPSLLP